MSTNYRLRPLEASDANALVHHANNKKIARYMTNQFPHPYTKEAANKFIQFSKTDNKSTIHAIDVNGEFVGALGIHQEEDVRTKNAEIGYWISERFWNKGIVSKAIKDVVLWGFNNLDIERIFARSYGSNAASQRVLVKNGFTHEATFKSIIYKWGEWEDEVIYAIRRDEI